MGANAESGGESKAATNRMKGESPAPLTADGTYSVSALVVEVERGGRCMGNACNTTGTRAKKKPAYLIVWGRVRRLTLWVGG